MLKADIQIADGDRIILKHTYLIRCSDNFNWICNPGQEIFDTEIMLRGYKFYPLCKRTFVLRIAVKALDQDFVFAQDIEDEEITV